MAATLSPSMLALLLRLCAAFPRRVVIISGRKSSTLRGFLGEALASRVTIAASHGHDVSGPGIFVQVGAEYVPDLAKARDELRARLRDVPGAAVEDNTFSISTHLRCVAEQHRAGVAAAVAEVCAAANSAGSRICLRAGADVLELRPACEPPWHKGTAALHLLRALKLDAADASVLALGDDLTDEDTFAALLPPAGSDPKQLAARGIPIIVAPRDSPLAAPGSACVVISRHTRAAYALRGVVEVEAPRSLFFFLTALSRDTGQQDGGVR